MPQINHTGEHAQIRRNHHRQGPVKSREIDSVEFRKLPLNDQGAEQGRLGIEPGDSDNQNSGGEGDCQTHTTRFYGAPISENDRIKQLEDEIPA